MYTGMTLPEARAYVQSVSIPTGTSLEKYRLACEAIVENRCGLSACVRIFIPEDEDTTADPAWDKVIDGSQPLYQCGTVRVVHNHND